MARRPRHCSEGRRSWRPLPRSSIVKAGRKWRTRTGASRSWSERLRRFQARAQDAAGRVSCAWTREKFYRRRNPCAGCGWSHRLPADAGRRKASAVGKGERFHTHTHKPVHKREQTSVGHWRVVERAEGAVRGGRGSEWGDVAVNRRWLKGVLRSSDPVVCACTGRCEIRHLLERPSSSFGLKCMFV